MNTIKRYLNIVMSESWLRSALVLALLAIGCIGLFFGARMAYKFGLNMSYEHAVTLVLVALLAAFSFPAADMLKKANLTGATKLATVVGMMCLGMELVTHMGYTFGQRHDNVTKAMHQTVAYQEQQSALQEDKRNLAMWESRLSDLTQQNGWAATVTADGLRAQLPGLNLAIDQEAARGGCKDKCLARTKERDTIKSRIATLEERTDLQQKIEATKRVLDKQRDKAASTDLGNSAVVEQSNAFAKLFNMSLTPDGDSIEWTKYILGIMIAVVTVIIAPAAFKMALLIAAMEGIGSTRAIGTLKPISPPTPANDGNPVTINVSQADNSIWEALHNALNQPKRIAA